jgi:hypothetical protein
MLNPPLAQKFAERVVAQVAGQLGGGDGALATLASLHERLGRVLVPVVGDGGYRAIFARSARKARTAHPCLAGVALGKADPFLDPLLARLRTEEEGTIRATTVALMAHLIELMTTLVGPELTLTLLRREWPAAPADALVPRERP